MLIILGSIIGVLKEDTRSLDYNSRVVRGPGSRDSLKVVWGLGFKGEFLT